MARYNRERGCPLNSNKKKSVLYVLNMFLTRKPNARVKWPLEFLSLTICFFVYWRWTNSYLIVPFLHIYIQIYIYIRINIIAHCTPTFCTHFSYSINIVTSKHGFLNRLNDMILISLLEYPPPFSPLFKNVMLFKTIFNYDQAATVFQ